ncbi:MAG: hypothetical protein HY712_06475 [candidate division NC10 bacterium]|nr:hypothetical protein [candidate division NC10 bacterium]
MSQRGRFLIGLLFVGVGLGSGGIAGAFEIFPDAQVHEAHTLRQRVLDATPGLDLARPRTAAALPAESLAEAAKSLAALEGREAANPFFHWLRGEILRRTQGMEVAGASFERAAERAGTKAVIHWILWQEHLARGLWREAERHEQALLPLEVRLGLAHAPLISQTLVRAAEQAAGDGDSEAAARLYDRALLYQAGQVEALAGRAAMRWGLSPGRLFGAARDVAQSVWASLGHRITGGRLMSNLLWSLMSAWLLCLLVAAGVAALRTHTLFFHDLREGPFRPFLPAVQRSLGLLVLLAPLMLGLGLAWTALGMLLLLAPYLTPRERTVVSVLVAGLAIVPIGYRWIAAQHILAASPRMATSLAAERGETGDGLLASLEAWRTENPKSGLAAYYLGLLQKRRGELAAAEANLAEAVKLRPGWSFAHTGLGNLHFLAGRLKEAEASYQRAASIHPAFASAANLGTVYTLQMQLDKSSEWMTRSARLDIQAAALLARAGSSGRPAVVMDEPVPGTVLAAGLYEGDEDDVVAEGFWGRPLRGVRVRWLAGVALVFLVAFWTHARLRGGRVATRCQECGTPFCVHCQSDFRERAYCSPCAPVFRDREGVPAMVKLARQREADGWSRQEARRTVWLGTLIPGGGWWYRGGVLALPVCLVSLWALLEGLLLDAVAPNLRFPSPLPSALRWTGAAAAVLILQSLSAWRSRVVAAAAREDRKRALRGAWSGAGREGEESEPLRMRE